MPWKRFWRALDAPALVDRDGFLVLPHVGDPRALATLDQLDALPCVVLLGEAGAGKTSALYGDAERLRAAGRLSEPIDLGSLGSEETLRGRIAKATEGAVPERPRTLLFDGLDEAILRVDRAARALPDALGAASDPSSLRVRITCRTGSLPSSLRPGLERIWGPGGVGVFELAALTREDVDAALAATGLDTDPALREQLMRPPVASLAARPITLDLLLSLAARSGALPRSLTQLFDRAMDLLCTEPNEERPGALKAPQRRAVAGRLAAITLLCARPRVRVRGAIVDVDEATIRVEELAGGEEAVPGSTPLTVGEDAVREVVENTQLFPAAECTDAPPPVTWRHRSYAEFLAAERIGRTARGAEGLRWVTDPGREDGRVVPQLRGVAAWLASRDPAVFQALLERDPEVLLRADPEVLPPEHRRALIERVLQLDDAAEALPWWHDERPPLAPFAHADIDAQLRGWVVDPAHSTRARVAALRALLALPKTGLVDDLARLALDEAQPIEVRVDAARIVRREEDPARRAALLPLARGSVSDERDQLKGIALDALWPDQIPPHERFAWLTPFKDERYYGAYSVFLTETLPARLRVDDIPAALAWAQTSLAPRSQWPPDPTRARLIDLAVAHLDRAEVFGALADYVVAALLAYVRPLQGIQARLRLLSSEQALRRRLLDRLLATIPLDARSRVGLWCELRALVDERDFNWLLEQVAATPAGSNATILARITRDLYFRPDPPPPEWTEALASNVERSEALREATRDVWEGWSLDDESIQAMRDHHRRELERGKRLEAAEAARSREIARYLSEAETRDVTSWWRLVFWINAEMTPDAQAEERLRASLYASPFWRSASLEVRERLTALAARYLVEADPDASEWFAQKTWFWPAAGGRAALALLASAAPARLSDLPAEVWARWCCVLLDPLWSGEDGPPEVRAALLHRAQRFAPTAFRESLLAMVDHENREHGWVHVLGGADLTVDASLVGELVQRLTSQAFAPGAFGQVLEAVRHVRLELADEVACDAIVAGWDASGRAGECATEAARVLLSRSPELAWSLLSDRFTRDPTRGASIVQRAEARTHSARWRPAFSSPTSMASFFRWARTTMKGLPSPSMHERLRGVVTPRDVLSWVASVVLDDLVAHGSREALEQVARLVREYSDDDGLRTAARLTRDRFLDLSWRPRAVADVRDWSQREAPGSAKLRDILSHWFHVEGVIRMIAKDAGLRLDAIDFHGSAQLIWHSVLEEARNSGSLPRVVQHAAERGGDVASSLAPFLDGGEDSQH